METSTGMKFKKCSHCGEWFTRDDFVNRQDLKPIGMTFVDSEVSLACFFFQHESPKCGTCLAVPVAHFDSYIAERIPEFMNARQDGCGHHCTSVEDFTICSLECNFAPYRRLLMHMIEQKGRATPRSKSVNAEESGS